MAKSQIASNSNHNHNGALPRRRYDYSGIYRWIVKYATIHHGRSPSFDEIRTEFAIPSKSTVYSILNALERGGFIQRERDCKRSIVIVGARWTPPARV